jgi:hypothetical protein
MAFWQEEAAGKREIRPKKMPAHRPAEFQSLAELEETGASSHLPRRSANFIWRYLSSP